MSVGRKLVPKAPEIMMLVLFLGRLDERVDPEKARIHFFNKTFDRSSLSRRVRSLYHNDKAMARGNQGPLKKQQSKLIFFNPGLVFFLIDGSILIQFIKNNPFLRKLLVFSHDFVR